MPELTGQVGELTMTIQIKRKETGKVEEYILTAPIDEEQEAQLKGLNDGSHSLDSK